MSLIQSIEECWFQRKEEGKASILLILGALVTEHSVQVNIKYKHKQ